MKRYAVTLRITCRTSAGTPIELDRSFETEPCLNISEAEMEALRAYNTAGFMRGFESMRVTSICEL